MTVDSFAHCDVQFGGNVALGVKDIVVQNFGTISTNSRVEQMRTRHYGAVWQNQSVLNGSLAMSPDDLAILRVECEDWLDLLEAKFARPDAALVEYEFDVSTLGDATTVLEALRAVRSAGMDAPALGAALVAAFVDPVDRVEVRLDVQSQLPSGALPATADTEVAARERVLGRAFPLWGLGGLAVGASAALVLEGRIGIVEPPVAVMLVGGFLALVATGWQWIRDGQTATSRR